MFKYITFLCIAMGSLLIPFEGKAEIQTYENGKQLLEAINAKMKKMNHSTFTHDELVVWLASQADGNRVYGELQPQVADFLEQLVLKKIQAPS